jgi:hypothetical protein
MAWFNSNQLSEHACALILLLMVAVEFCCRKKTEGFWGFERETKFQQQLVKRTFSKATTQKHFSIVQHLGAISVGDVHILFPQERCRIIFKTSTINLNIDWVLRWKYYVFRFWVFA